MNLDALTPATTKENTELLRALLSNAVLMREALERINNRLHGLDDTVNALDKTVCDISISIEDIRSLM